MIIGSILAGGTGVRMDKHNIPKQFIDLCGKPVIIHTIERMLAVKAFEYIYIAIHPNYKEYLQQILKTFNLANNSKIIIIDGGKERIDSVQNVVNAAYELNHNENDIIVLHDAVRPFTSVKVFENCINAAKEYGATIATIPAVDTMLVSQDGEFLDDVPNRKTILHGQAPDGFQLGILKKAIEELTPQERSYITGTAQICCVKGYKVKVIKGDVKNMKITVEQDLILAEKIYLQEVEHQCVQV
ncbi:MAG: 2-C-methyl-D-erythritol 4-phosphate cytidylyltransferase [Candidatus Gastranaerophilaceae bacterium]